MANFDRDKIGLSLYFSRLAGLTKEELHKHLPSATFIENKDTDTQCFIYKHLRMMIISFRGTQQPQDWLTDINAWHTTFPYGNKETDIRVHKGFMNAYRSVRGDILAHLTKSKDEWDSVFVCGHSLGGALAILCAVDIQYNITSHVECYPNGNPAVGNDAFVKSYNKRVVNTVRTYMRTDIVPTLPPHWILKRISGGYSHVKVANPIGPRNIFIGIINWIKTKRGKLDAADLANHSIDLYEEYI